MKRKYTRKVSPSNVQSKPSLVKGRSKDKLPPDILANIERAAAYRKALGLFDDREERIEHALKYQGFMND